MDPCNQHAVVNKYTRTLLALLLVICSSVSVAQNKVVVVPLGGDDVGQCTVSSDCGDSGNGAEATLTCPSGDIVIPCGLPSNNEFKRVFITSSLHTGDLGGLLGADAICQELADSSMLGGVYKAWLSDASGNQSPSTRFTRSNVPYLLADGTQIAADYDDLVDGAIMNPINRNENDELVAEVTAWTNTGADGSTRFLSADGSCDGWTSSSSGFRGLDGGSVSVDDDDWTSATLKQCNSSRHLYCFEQ